MSGWNGWLTTVLTITRFLHLSTLAIAAVFAALTAVGCAPVQEEIDRGPDIADAFYGKMDALTGIMKQDANPDETLNALRMAIEKDKADMAQTVNKLNQDVLAMTEEQRSQWRKETRPVIEKKLSDFAEAQNAFRKNLNDAQKWELGEILAQLKIQ